MPAPSIDPYAVFWCCTTLNPISQVAKMYGISTSGLHTRVSKVLSYEILLSRRNYIHNKRHRKMLNITNTKPVEYFYTYDNVSGKLLWEFNRIGGGG